MEIVADTLISRVPTLISIKDKKYRTSTSTVDVVSILQRGQQRVDATPHLSEKDMESMEREYFAALRRLELVGHSNINQLRILCQRGRCYTSCLHLAKYTKLIYIAMSYQGERESTVVS